jgi:hypothetical protein
MHDHLSTPTTDEKRSILESVLHSDTFARADQLKSFLKYVCEMEIAGRAEEISEYLVGVEALGKPVSFSTVEDTSVRNRAYALRQKLDKYFADEALDAPVRIEFVKGTYVPRFARVAHLPRVEEIPLAAPRPAPDSAVAVERRGKSVRLAIALALVAGLLIGSVGTVLITRGTGQALAPPSVDPIVREAWGPLLDPHGNVLICLASAAQLTLLPFDIKVEWQPELPVFRAPAQLYSWYVRHHRYFSGKELFMSPDVNSPHFGDVLGALTAIKTLTAAGCPYKLLPERVVPIPTLSARNSILLGVPHKSEAISKLLNTGRFQFGYDPKIRDITITMTGAQPHVYSGRRDDRTDRVESFGLITVSPLDLGTGATGRVVAFSGDPSAGAAAAAEFFASPEHLKAFKEKLLAEGYKQFPAAYQILIRCKLDSNLATSYGYETHAVLK